MSIIDNAAHSVVSYDAKTSKPFTGQRLAKVCFKTITDPKSLYCNIKRDNKCVSIPMVAGSNIEQNLPLLMPHIIEFVAGVQDKIIREKIEAGATFIAQNDIEMVAVIDWLESNNESGRLTKESVSKWFDENVQDTLMVALADKLGVSDVPTDEQAKQIELVLGQFREKVSALAGGKTMYEPKMCDSLIKCLELAPAGDALAARFVGRLNKMKDDASKNIGIIDLL